MKRIAVGVSAALLLLILTLVFGGWFGSGPLVLTGLVTTDEVVVSPQIGGRIARLLVKEGDTVNRDQLLAVITPDELRAESAYYASSADALASQVEGSEAALRMQEQQTVDQIRQAEATLASAEAQQAAARADRENSQLAFERSQQLLRQGFVSQGEFDQARTGHESAEARLVALQRQADAARAALALARANAEQVAMHRHQLESAQQQQAAAAAQRAKADVRLTYTELHAPIAGIIDVRAAQAGEVIVAGQPVLTLIDLDDLWVRVDVEETYIDKILTGQHLKVRLPSGDERDGVVFYRGVDAGFATQRDVSRFKRDIKTFEVRLRVDNADRRLAVGMTAYVLLPVT